MIDDDRPLSKAEIIIGDNAFKAARKTVDKATRKISEKRKAAGLPDLSKDEQADLADAAGEAAYETVKRVLGEDGKLPSEDSAPPSKRKGKAASGLEAAADRLADIFAEEHRHDLRHVAAWGQWYEWREGCWREDVTLRTFDLIRKTCKAHGVKLNSMAKIVGAVHGLARTDRRLVATVEQWDADPWALNTADGIVNLRNGTTRKHDPNAYCTKMTAAAPRGDCPMWKAFLRKITNGDDALISYLQRVLGYCLTGDVSEQAIFFNYGIGQNGKTVLMSTASGILSDYCLATPIETFTESKTDRHPTELARMRGARLVTATETEAGRYWAESRLKELTGGERVPARFMHKNFFEFAPEFKPWISGNHRPRLRGVGVAMRRRLNMIPFSVTIPEDERDPQLVAKLKGEWPGILTWMIGGCLDWQERGLAPPEAVTKATHDYFTGEDGYADWIADRCEISAGVWSRSSELFASWRDWAEKAGQPPRDTKQFREEMERLGYPHRHISATNVFCRHLPSPRPRHALADVLSAGDRIADPVTAGDGSEVNRRISRARSVTAELRDGQAFIAGQPFNNAAYDHHLGYVAIDEALSDIMGMPVSLSPFVMFWWRCGCGAKFASTHRRCVDCRLETQRAALRRASAKRAALRQTERDRKLICCRCGAPLVGSRRRSKAYCSNACRQAHWRETQSAREDAVERT